MSKKTKSAKTPKTATPAKDLTPSARELAERFTAMHEDVLRQMLVDAGEQVRAKAKKADLVKRCVSIRLRDPKALADTAPKGEAAPKGDAPTAGAGRRADPAAVGLTVGQTIERVYKSDKYVVTVLKDGFQYKGKTYPSLTAVSLEIAGHRNGWQFFGLRPGRGAKNSGARAKRTEWLDRMGLDPTHARALSNARRVLDAHKDKIDQHAGKGATASVLDEITHLVNGWAGAPAPEAP